MGLFCLFSVLSRVLICVVVLLCSGLDSVVSLLMMVVCRLVLVEVMYWVVKFEVLSLWLVYSIRVWCISCVLVVFSF